MVFAVPDGAVVAPKDREKAAKLGYVGNYTRLGNSCWFTNLDHGRRHQPLSLMTMADNIKFSRHKEIKGIGYQTYDNYDAIEVPFTDAIPADYDGIMGVPITFLSKHCPEQFAIIGLVNGKDDLVDIDTTREYKEFREVRQTSEETGANGGKIYGNPVLKGKPNKGNYFVFKDECVYSAYARIFIKRRQS